TRVRSSARRPGSTRPARRRSLVSAESFGFQRLTALCLRFARQRIGFPAGRAAAVWSERGRVFIGRDTRASGVELEQAFARGVASAGGNAVLAGVLPTPAVALLALDLGAVVSASHNPPEYNGVKLFDSEGRKLTDAAEEQIEFLLDEPPAASPGQIDRVEVATDSYLDHIVERFGSNLAGLRVVVDCANGAY